MREEHRLPETRDFPAWKEERRGWFTSADEVLEEGRDHEGKREHAADRRADDRHGLGPLRFAGEVGDRRDRDPGDGAGPLEDAPQDHAVGAVGSGAHEAARGEDRETHVEHGLAAHAVRKPAEGDLQQPLGEAVGPHGDARKLQVPSRPVARPKGEHGQDHEHAEEAEGEDRGESPARTKLRGAHAGRGIHGGNAGVEKAWSAPVY